MKSTRFKIFVITLFTMSTILLLPPYSHANVIFSNFGPLDTYNVMGGWSIYNNENGTQDTAMGFVPSDNFSLDSIKLAIGLNEGPNEIDVLLMSWVPTPIVIEAFHFTNAMYPDGNPVLTANSVLHPELDAGQTYWLAAILATNPAAETNPEYASWKFNSMGDYGLVGGRLDGGTWVGGSGMDTAPRGAFEIDGTSSVPEPSSILLLGFGLAGVGLLRKRFKN